MRFVICWLTTGVSTGTPSTFRRRTEQPDADPARVDSAVDRPRPQRERRLAVEEQFEVVGNRRREPAVHLLMRRDSSGGRFSSAAGAHERARLAKLEPLVGVAVGRGLDVGRVVVERLLVVRVVRVEERLLDVHQVRRPADEAREQPVVACAQRVVGQVVAGERLALVLVARRVGQPERREGSLVAAPRAAPGCRPASRRDRRCRCGAPGRGARPPRRSCRALPRRSRASCPGCPGHSVSGHFGSLIQTT